MGYIEKNLIAGEQVLYKTRLHSAAVVGPLLASLCMGVAAISCFYQGSNRNQNAGSDSRLWVIAGAILLIVGALTLCAALVRRNATEMAVTNRRILVKSGLLSRRTIEMLLSRVESIVVTEPLLGRILGYGTVIIRGTGGTPEPFSMIAQPTEFRRAVQEQIEASQAEMRPAGAVHNSPNV
jgi:uncharacterized membrane protein YdbT with pleckstrin-like domain